MSYQYPKHLSDELRKEIAVSYVRHELRKLFPSLKKNADFKKIDKDVSNWLSGNPTLTPVRDFWNGVHGISMGFRLKHIGEWLTSTNIVWKKKNIALKKIRFGATFDELAVVGIRPSIEDVRAWYFAPENKQALLKARKAHKKRSAETADRDKFPVIIRQLLGDEMVVMDGNRRLLRSVLFEKETVEAFVGKQKQNPPLSHYWVPTSLLLELITANRYWTKLGRNVTASIAKVATELVRDSSVGQQELKNRCVDPSLHKEDAKLLTAIEKRLGKL